MWPGAKTNAYDEQLALALQGKATPGNNGPVASHAAAEAEVLFSAMAALRRREAMAFAAAGGADPSIFTAAAANGLLGDSSAYRLALTDIARVQQESVLRQHYQHQLLLQQQRNLLLGSLAYSGGLPYNTTAAPGGALSNASLLGGQRPASAVAENAQDQKRAQFLAQLSHMRSPSSDGSLAVASQSQAGDTAIAASALQQLSSAQADVNVSSLASFADRKPKSEVSERPKKSNDAAVSPVSSKEVLSRGVATKGVHPFHLKKQSFPEKVYCMLLDLEDDKVDPNTGSVGTNVISFVAEGSAFMIHQPPMFETDVMPMYFSSNRMSSFQRQLNIYGFERVETGPWRGAYRHEYFKRGQPELLKNIIRTKQQNRTKKNAAAAATTKSNEAVAAEPETKEDGSC